uniref:ribosomal protein S3 n=1 Tax=Ishige okamurae TaxID=233772 RepID=UPI002E772E35|nr:ribosomal protein S3 [Ishige okamurae]WBP70200.1 ribosomal protein S3 [Ishige okamurae]
MGHKAHPVSLRPNLVPVTRVGRWDETRLNFVTSLLKNALQGCCHGSDVKFDSVSIYQYHNKIIIYGLLIHFHPRSPKQFFSRRKKDVKRSQQDEKKVVSWPRLANRLNTLTKTLQKLISVKIVKLRINRRLAFSRGVPKETLKKMGFYIKPYHKKKYIYARYGLQLLNFALKGKVTSYTIASFFKIHMLALQRQQKHRDFLRFVVHAFQALEKVTRLGGLKIKVKGRFAPRAKARSRTWKYQVGKLPLAQFRAPIDAYYTSTQTEYGSVGLKVWLYSYKECNELRSIKTKC